MLYIYLKFIKYVFRSFILSDAQQWLSFIIIHIIYSRYFTIATEIGVFQELAPLCFAALRESMFGGGSFDKDDDDDDEGGEAEEEDDLYGLSRKDLATKGIVPSTTSDEGDSGRQTMSPEPVKEEVVIEEDTKTEVTVEEDKRTTQADGTDVLHQQVEEDKAEVAEAEEGQTVVGLDENKTEVERDERASGDVVNEATNEEYYDSQGDKKVNEGEASFYVGDEPDRRQGEEAEPSPPPFPEIPPATSDVCRPPPATRSSRQQLRRTSSQLSQPLPEVLCDSDDDDYEYHDGNISVVKKTVYIRRPSEEENVDF